jgi:hypothetical protein
LGAVGAAYTVPFAIFIELPHLMYVLASRGRRAPPPRPVNVGPVGVSAKAEAMVGGEANANLGVDKAGVHVGSEAFAGAKGGGEFGADVGGVSAGFSAEGWAGPGAEANF